MATAALRRRMEKSARSKRPAATASANAMAQSHAIFDPIDFIAIIIVPSFAARSPARQRAAHPLVRRLAHYQRILGE
jgi:hypothetical protein